MGHLGLSLSWASERAQYRVVDRGQILEGESLAVITLLAEGVQVALRLKGSLDIEEAVQLVGFKCCAVCVSWG